jgi:hypothetical protein
MSRRRRQDIGHQYRARPIRVGYKDGSTAIVGLIFDGRQPSGDEFLTEDGTYVRRPHHPECADPGCPIPAGVEIIWLREDIVAEDEASKEEGEDDG